MRKLVAPNPFISGVTEYDPLVSYPANGVISHLWFHHCAFAVVVVTRHSTIAAIHIIATRMFPPRWYEHRNRTKVAPSRATRCPVGAPLIGCPENHSRLAGK